MSEAPKANEVHEQLALMQQQRLDTYSHIVEKANEREASFSKALDVLQQKQVVEFSVNTLVQVYHSDLDYMFKTKRKLLPKRGPVCWIVGRNRNSYKVATLEGLTLKGWFSARHLREFTAKPRTELDKNHEVLKSAVALIQGRAGITSVEINDVKEAGNEGEPDGPQHERNREVHQDTLAWERVAAQIDETTTQAQSKKDVNREELDGKDGASDEVEGVDEQEDQIDDGMVLGGWAEPGCLRHT